MKNQMSFDNAARKLAKDLKVHIKRNRITYQQLAYLLLNAHDHAVNRDGFVDWVNVERRTECGVQAVGPTYRGAMPNILRVRKGEPILP